MICPDDSHLDHWIDDARVASHVADCPPCATRHLMRQTEERFWQAALGLDGAELAHLARANLVGPWLSGTHPALQPSGPALWWPALVLLGALAAWAAWVTAMPWVGEGTGWLGRLGVVGIGLSWLAGRLWDGASALGSALESAALGDPTLLLAAVSFGLWLYVARPWALTRAD
jgi:hypothetical protein